MTLEELSKEYNERAAVLVKRISELKEKCKTLSPEQKRKTYRRIRSLADSAINCKHIASKLAGYYRNGDENA